MFKLIWNALSFVGLLALFTTSMFVAGYESEKRWASEERSGPCINAACEHACTEKQSRFKRHGGPCGVPEIR